MLDSNAPRTMMILGAVLSGGDCMSLARQLAEDDTRPDSPQHETRNVESELENPPGK